MLFISILFGFTLKVSASSDFVALLFRLNEKVTKSSRLYKNSLKSNGLSQGAALRKHPGSAAK
jgi:hypothetical protein